MKFETLRKVREEKGWTMEKLAEKSGVTTRTIYNVERGKACNFGTAKLLARALGIKLDSLKDNGHA